MRLIEILIRLLGGVSREEYLALLGAFRNRENRWLAERERADKLARELQNLRQVCEAQHKDLVRQNGKSVVVRGSFQ